MPSSLNDPQGARPSASGPRRRFPRTAAAEVALAVAVALIVVATAGHPAPELVVSDHPPAWRKWTAVIAVLVFYHGLVRIGVWLRRSA